MATYVLVHGGGHGGWCWDRVAPLLREEGHAVHCPTLTGLAERAHLLTAGTGLNTHVADIADLLEARDLRDVILVGHSYGGMVITGVADRAPGRIAQLVYLDAPHPRHGEALVDSGPNARARLSDQMQVIDGIEMVLMPSVQLIHFFGVTDPDDVAWLLKKLTPHPKKCFEEPLMLRDQDGMLAIPRTSIDCLATMALREPAMNARAKTSHRAWEIDAGHDLMITEPVKTAEMLLRLANL